MGTYLIAYEEELTRQIEQGGDQTAIDRAMDAYNHFERSAFEDWLRVAKPDCIHCGKPARLENVDLVEEITCELHKS